MAFDRNNPADLLALKNEVTLDPIGMGYNPISSVENLISMLNDPAANVSPANGVAQMTGDALLGAIFSNAISSQDQFVIQLMYQGISGLDEDLSKYRDQVKGLSTPLGTAIDALPRPLSRAEVLFSNLDENGSTEIVNLTEQDWIVARDS